MNEKMDRLRPLIRSFLDKGPAGNSLKVMQAGKILFEDYAGIAKLETNRPVSADTIFRVYSMTKVVTAVAALQLWEKGLYLLSDPLHEYLPEFADSQVFAATPNGDIRPRPAKSPILVQDLFCMSSGLTYGDPVNETGRTIGEALTRLQGEKSGRYTVREMSKAIATAPLAFDPGTHWYYSLSFDVLGAFIEALSGERFGDYLEKHIFAPLGMKETGFRIAEEKRERLAGRYMLQDGKRVPEPVSKDEDFQEDATYESGGGGLLSTLDDFSKFAQALACGGKGVIHARTIDLMRANRLNEEQMKDFNWTAVKGYGYGLGVRTMIDPAEAGSNGSIGEFGWAGLLGTWVMIDPSEELSAVYLQQFMPNYEGFIQPRLRNVIYGAL